MDPVIGEVRLFGGNFAPQSWAFCNGQLLSISQYTALFSILGTTYGGDGVTTFALPDLRGRVAVHANNGSAPIEPVSLGQVGGSASVTLTSAEMPAHNHALNGSSSSANNVSPQSNIPAILTDSVGEQNGDKVYQTGAPNVQMNSQAISIAGQSQPHDNLQPYLGLNYIIALEGLYPSRN